MPLALAIIPKGFEEAQKLLTKVGLGFPKVAAKAINEGLRAGRTLASKNIRERYKIKAAELKGEGMKTKKANASNLDASLEFKGKMLPVTLFSPRVAKVKLRKTGRQYVSAEIIRGNRKLVKGAFIAKGRVWERRQPKRIPIFPVSTISVAHMVGHQKISDDVQETIAKTTSKRMDHYIGLALSGPEGRAIVSAIGKSSRL